MRKEIQFPNVLKSRNSVELVFATDEDADLFRRWIAGRSYDSGWPAFTCWADIEHEKEASESLHVHPPEMPCNVMCPGHPNTVKRRSSNG